MLARRGCIAYANEMLRVWPTDVMFKIYASRYCEEPLLPNCQRIITFRGKFSFVWNSLFYLPLLLWNIRKDIGQGYRIVYFPMFHHWNPAIILTAKWLGAKTFITVHDAIAHPGEQHLAQDRFQRWAWQWSDQVIALSEFVKSQLPIDVQQKTTVIPHPILAIPKSSCRRVLSRPARVLFLGRIAYYKGVDLLLDAVRDLPKNVIGKLTIAGMPMMELALPTANFPIQVHRAWLSDDEIKQLLQTHNILVLPYREASQSGIIGLGIAAAIPMVITKVGGLVEQLPPNGAVWVNPEAESVRQGILQLIENPGLYQAIHESLLLISSEKQNEAIVQQLLALFRRSG